MKPIQRRLRAALTIAGLVLVLAGCVDVVQYVSGAGGTIDVYLRFALQKSAFEMANGFSDDPRDLDEMFEEDFDLEREEVLGELPPGIEADYRALDSEFEYGFELTYSADRELLARLEPGDAAFVPRVGPRGITIPLAQGGSGGAGGEGDEFAAAFLGGAKYRLFISRLLVSRVSSAVLVTGRQITPITVTELPDVWMIEFPVALWLMASEEPSVEVRF